MYEIWQLRAVIEMTEDQKEKLLEPGITWGILIQEPKPKWIERFQSYGYDRVKTVECQTEEEAKGEFADWAREQVEAELMFEATDYGWQVRMQYPGPVLSMQPS